MLVDVVAHVCFGPSVMTSFDSLRVASSVSVVAAMRKKYRRWSAERRRRVFHGHLCKLALKRLRVKFLVVLVASVGVGVCVGVVVVECSVDRW